MVDIYICSLIIGVIIIREIETKARHSLKQAACISSSKMRKEWLKPFSPF